MPHRALKVKGELLVGVGFAGPKLIPWTIAVIEEGDNGEMAVVCYDVDRRRVGKGYVRREASSCAYDDGEEISFADTPQAYWARPGFDVWGGTARRIEKLPAKCRGLLKRTPIAHDLLGDKGPDDTK